MKEKESVGEFVSIVMRESKFDADIDYCKKHGITFPQRDEDLEDEDEVFARLSDTKRNSAVFDFLTKGEDKNNAMYNYNDELNKTVQSFKDGTITKDEANSLLQSIEKSAYEADTSAEPDGNITYAVATAFDEINNFPSK